MTKRVDQARKTVSAISLNESLSPWEKEAISQTIRSWDFDQEKANTNSDISSVKVRAAG